MVVLSPILNEKIEKKLIKIKKIFVLTILLLLIKKTYMYSCIKNL